MFENVETIKKIIMKEISRVSLETKLPFWQTLTSCLALYCWGSPFWWGFIGTFLVLWWTIAIIIAWKEDKIDILEKIEQLEKRLEKKNY